MTRGFAILAYPADYRNSGVTSFLINQDGVVFQKDLGPQTAEVANLLTNSILTKAGRPLNRIYFDFLPRVAVMGTGALISWAGRQWNAAILRTSNSPAGTRRCLTALSALCFSARPVPASFCRVALRNRRHPSNPQLLRRKLQLRPRLNRDTRKPPRQRVTRQSRTKKTTKPSRIKKPEKRSLHEAPLSSRRFPFPALPSVRESSRSSAISFLSARRTRFLPLPPSAGRASLPTTEAGASLLAGSFFLTRDRYEITLDTFTVT